MFYIYRTRKNAEEKNLKKCSNKIKKYGLSCDGKNKTSSEKNFPVRSILAFSFWTNIFVHFQNSQKTFFWNIEKKCQTARIYVLIISSQKNHPKNPIWTYLESHKELYWMDIFGIP